MILFFPVAGLLFDSAPQFWQICLLIAGGYFRCLKPAAPRIYCSPCVYVAADRYLRSGTDEIVSGIYVRVKVCFVTEQLDIFFLCYDSVFFRISSCSSHSVWAASAVVDSPVPDTFCTATAMVSSSARILAA